MNVELLERLARSHDTPFYAYDLDQVRRRADELLAVLPARAALFYSFKSNPLPSIARVLAKRGCRADITSVGELEAARGAGFDLGQALIGGPGLADADIRAALEAGVRTFSCESYTILERLAAAARTLAVRPTVLLRVNPAEPPKAKLAMTGVSSQFGLDEDALVARGAESLAPYREALDIVGVHVYFGTQMGGPAALAACTSAALDAALRVSTALKFTLRIVNVGGGFPWPYAVDEAPVDLAPLREMLEGVVAERRWVEQCAIWFESGRYLSASSGTLVARVLDEKVSRGRRYVILDTGIHHLGGMSGLGRIPRQTITLRPVAQAQAEPASAADIAGPLCSPLDCVARGIAMPSVRPGDLVAVPNVGAYGLTASLTAFLSRPTPLEIAYDSEGVVAVERLNWGHAAVSKANQSQEKRET
jgi:diaminopimelate decarboxylase